MTEEQVLDLYELFAARSIDCWILGGWGDDALLGTQTREHKDLDLLIRVEDVESVMKLLEEQGFQFAYAWPENTWIEGERIPTAFVMTHRDGRALDFHAARFTADGRVRPAWETTRVISAADLAGIGIVGGRTVRCSSAIMQFRVHEEYELPAEHARDMALLRDVFSPDPQTAEEP